MSSKRWTFLFLFLLTACHASEEAHHEEFKGATLKVREQGQEFRVPTQAWDILLRDEAAEKAAAANKGKKAEGAEEGELKTASFLYAPIRVILQEKNHGVLREPEIHIDLPEGGGEVDLAKWTTGQTGTFFVRFEWGGRETTASESRVLFYSRSRKRKVGDQVVGSGCQALLDLTKMVSTAPSDGGITLNTTRNFHSTVLGGHFLFSWMSEGMRKITHVTFRDSANPALWCEKGS